MSIIDFKLLHYAVFELAIKGDWGSSLMSVPYQLLLWKVPTQDILETPILIDELFCHIYSIEKVSKIF